MNWLKASEKEGLDEVFVLYSQEEPEVRIYHRLLSLRTVDLGDGWTSAEVRDFLRGGRFSRGPDYRWPSEIALDEARGSLRNWEGRLLVVSRPAWTVEELEAHARDSAAHRKVGAILVDYLQRIPGPTGRRYDRRDIEVSTVARRLKSLAVVLNVPVVAAAQVNREAVPDRYREKLDRKNYEEAKEVIQTARPELHHLREGGAEQEADLVLGLLNYAADYRTAADSREARQVPHVTCFEVGTLKSRYGNPGRWAALAFEGRFHCIRDQHRYEPL